MDRAHAHTSFTLILLLRSMAVIPYIYHSLNDDSKIFNSCTGPSVSWFLGARGSGFFIITVFPLLGANFPNSRVADLCSPRYCLRANKVKLLMMRCKSFRKEFLSPIADFLPAQESIINSRIDQREIWTTGTPGQRAITLT